MAICNICPNHSKNHKTVRIDAHCRACGCTLSAKTACMSCECPIGKWKAEMAEEDYKEYYELNNKQDGETNE